MRHFFGLYQGFIVLIFTLGLNACTKGGSSSSSSNSSKSSTSSNELTLETFKTGPSSNLNPETYAEILYTRFAPFRITGSCKGGVKKVAIAVTQSGQSNQQVMDCSGGSFTWDTSFATEANHEVVFTAQSQDGQPIADLNPISKTIVYDITVPDQPTFLLPNTNNYLLVTDATSLIQIKGRVKTEVKKITGPNQLKMVLRPDSDGIHSTFIYNAPLTSNTVQNLVFTGYDAAGNSAFNTFTIETRTDVSVPLAVQEVGSSTVTSGSIVIQSSVGFLNGSRTNQNIKMVTGGTGTVGEW
jgi:hypothetical protein